MATITQNDPIDGAELKAIILKRIGDQMDRDCTLTNDVAYAGFALKYQIDLKFLRSKTAPTLIWNSTTENLQPEVERLDAEAMLAVPTETIADTYESDSPNTAREDHGLPVPVVVQTAAGMEKRRIHVNRKSDAK